MVIPVWKPRKSSGMTTIHDQTNARTQTRILIVSEDHDLTHLLANGVARLGLEVDLNSVSCMRMSTLNSLPHAGIILDLDMKESIGLEIIHDLHSENPLVPIMVVGEESKKYDIFFALMEGATDFLIKPVDSILLKRKCLRLFI